MLKRNLLDRLIVLFLFVIIIGNAFLTVALQNKTEIPITVYILFTVGIVGAVSCELVKKKSTPEIVLVEERKARDEWLKRGTFADFDIGPLIFLAGAFSEFLAFSSTMGLIIGILTALLYFIIAYSIFSVYKNKVSTFKWDYVFFLGTVFAIPSTAFILSHFQFLNEASILSVADSREFSLLTIITLQIGLIISSVITASRSWRTIFLKKHKFGIKDMQIQQAEVLGGLTDDPKRETFREIFSDMAIMRDALIFGQFSATVTCGWSIIDRALTKLSNADSTRKKAKELGIYTDHFEDCYKIRNKTVHAGYMPNFGDAFKCLQMASEVLVYLRNNPFASQKIGIALIKLSSE